MHVASVPGKRWMTREYLRVCFDYPFNQLKVKKIIGLVDSQNTDALKFDENLGFVTEYILQDAGKTANLHILSMTRQQCRFLKE
jgi:RimJ/RimL family protein N-acetyltransferase